jgi:hypothetical protein
MKKKKLKIENLKIESFSSQSLGDIKGGAKANAPISDNPLFPPDFTIDTTNRCCIQNDNT